HSGTEGHDGEPVEPSTRAEPVLALGERDEVVVDDRRQTRARLDEALQGHVLPAKERRVDDHAVTGERADPDPQSGDREAGTGESLDERAQLGDDLVRLARTERDLGPPDDVGP